MKGMGPREERETIIRFDDDSEMAEIWTASEVVYRRLKKRGFQPIEDDERHALFSFVKKAVRLPTKPRIVSEARKKAMSERGKNLYLGKSGT